LLDQPDRLLGLILLGNNLVNNFASALVTILVIQLYGESSLALGITALTVLMLITSEVAPKTLGALYPERLALPAAYVYTPLLRVTYPLVWGLNLAANGLLRLFGVQVHHGNQQSLSREELRTVMLEAGALIAKPHQDILLRVLDLELATVEDVMVPWQAIEALDLSDPPAQLSAQLARLPYSRVPVYEGQPDQVRGILPLRLALQALHGQQECTREWLEGLLEPAIFVTANTPLHKQLLRFRESTQRLGLVVDEYGDLLGLITLGDILEAVVGEFTNAQAQRALQPQADGSVIVSGQISLRELNRLLHLHFPVHGPRTLNGLILDHLEDIPNSPVGLRLAGYALDIVATEPHTVLQVRLYPQVARLEAHD
jgi:Mg2+/Co2+ transporter CorB